MSEFDPKRAENVKKPLPKPSERLKILEKTISFENNAIEISLLMMYIIYSIHEKLLHITR